MKKYKLGLIGYPLSHSFSKKYFNDKFLQEKLTAFSYHNFELKKISEFSTILTQEPELIGLNVTIPYKEAILNYVHELSDNVKAIGAANTLVLHKNGRIKAYNTDVYGFKESLIPLLKPYHKKALVLGSGGASKAVVYGLNQLGITATIVSRTPKNAQQITYEQIDENTMKTHLVVINTTPLGMMPLISLSPSIPYHFVTNKHLFYDLIYNPSQTSFLKQASQNGASVCNGLNMLYLQAEKAWKIWLENSDL